MKSMLKLMIVLQLALFASSAFADGILRQPRRNQDDRILPLEAVVADIEIHEQVALFTVRNSFTNQENENINAIYHYRLPADASVTGFGIWREDGFHKFELVSGEQGGPGGGAGDNEDLDDFLTDNSFSMPLDEIPPGLFMIELKYVMLLPYDFGKILLKYPLNTGDFLADNIDTVNIDVSIVAQRVIEEIDEVNLDDYSNIESHEAHSAEISFSAEDVWIEEDWECDIVFQQEDLGAWLYTHRADSEEDGYFLMVIEPGIVDTAEQVEKNFTFVFDRSGSMSGTRLTQAKSAVLSCFDHLVASDHFNVIDFATRVESFSDVLVPASIDNLDDAADYVRDLDADGRTNIYGALMAAVEQEMDEDAANQILFMTDGEPTSGVSINPETIIDSVTANNVWDARIHSFGIGDELDTQLLQGLSDANGGLVTLIEDRNASIDSIVAEFYSYFASPTLINPVIKFEDGLETDSIFPPELQDVAVGRQILLFGRYGSFGSYDMELNGTMADGDTTMTFEQVTFPEENIDNEFVPRMWAKSAIDYLLLQIDLHGEREEWVDKIIELSLRYGILTPYTEFIENDVEEAVSITAVNYVIQDKSLELHWQFVTDVFPVSFNVYKADNPHADFVKLNSTPLTRPEFIDNSFRSGMTACYKVEMIVGGVSYWSDLVMVGDLVRKLTMSEPQPNPFNDFSAVTFLLPIDGEVTLSLFDMNGRLVRTLLNEQRQAGIYNQTINSMGLPTGSYILRLEAMDQSLSKPLVILK